jgi:hypothetical protein
MEIVLVGSGRRRPLISWSAEARALFTEIAAEVEGKPGVRLGLQLKRPVIFFDPQGSRVRVAAAAFEDGIAVRLGPQDKARALQVFGTRELRRRDHMALRGMVAVPWSAHEHWRDLVHAAVSAG